MKLKFNVFVFPIQEIYSFDSVVLFKAINGTNGVYLIRQYGFAHVLNNFTPIQLKIIIMKAILKINLTVPSKSNHVLTTRRPVLPAAIAFLTHIYCLFV